jgi:hypothetical protein
MKTLKFSEPLPKLILKGKKNTTWRINDEKKIIKGDIVSLCYKDGKEFAKAQVLSTKETEFKNLNEEDFEGQAKFASENEICRVFSAYYKTKVVPETKVKIIKFKLI